MIHESAHYTVPTGTIDACREAIRELVDRVKEQPGVATYLVLENGDDQLTRFLHLAVFEDRKARREHHESEAMREFTDLVYPATLDGIDYDRERVVDRIQRLTGPGRQRTVSR